MNKKNHILKTKQLYKTFFFFNICFSLLSCNKTKNHQQEKLSKNKIENFDVENFNKNLRNEVQKSQEKMLKKSIIFKSLGNCENLTSEKGTNDIKILNKKITKTTLSVNFKFLQACCQCFAGDYKVVNETLIFEYENVGGGICKCECWYNYELKIENIKEKFSDYKIKQK